MASKKIAKQEIPKVIPDPIKLEQCNYLSP
jgi:hypothetical protein